MRDLVRSIAWIERAVGTGDRRQIAAAYYRAGKAFTDKAGPLLTNSFSHYDEIADILDHPGEVDAYELLGALRSRTLSALGTTIVIAIVILSEPMADHQCESLRAAGRRFFADTDEHRRELAAHPAYDGKLDVRLEVIDELSRMLKGFADKVGCFEPEN